MSMSSIKRHIGWFHVLVVQWTSKICTKKRNARAVLLFLFIEPTVFLHFRCRRHRSCLSSLITLEVA